MVAKGEIMWYLSNAFSINMINTDKFSIIRTRRISPSEIPKNVVSLIGHPDTARVVSNLLGFEVPCNRANLILGINDILYVAQYRGPRLPEGATELPKGVTIEFIEVTIQPQGCGECYPYNCVNCAIMRWIHGE